MKHKSLQSVVNSVAFMCFSLGFNMGIIAGALLYLELSFTELKEDRVLSGAVTASVLLSAFLANIVVGPLADCVGRVPVLHFTNIPFVLGAIVAALAESPAVLILGRSITGIAVGVAGTLPNLYIAEIAPPESRGRFVGRAPMCITIGIMSSQLVAVGIAKVLGEEQCVEIGWRVMFACGALPALIQGLWSLGIPESPRWCYQKNRDEKATQMNKVLSSLEGGAVIEGPTLGSWASQQSGRLSVKLSLIAGGLSAMQQLSGINAVIFYAPQIFRALGIVNTLAILVSSCISILQIMVVFGSTRLVDTWGRRKLCMVGIVGMVIGHLLLGLTFSFHLPAWMAVVGILAFRLLFSLSLGPLPYIMVTEIFPQHQRAKGVAMSMMVNWLLNWVVVFFTPELMHQYSGNVFFGFTVVCVVSFFVVKLCLPETAGIRLGELPGSPSPASFDNGVTSEGLLAAASYNEESCLSYANRTISNISTEYVPQYRSSDVLMASRQVTAS